MRTLFYLFILFVITQPAYAARPLVTDDARLTNAHSCQLESWMRSYKGGQELWALPACNLGENFEITLGGGSYRNNDDNYHTEDWVGQFKTLFKPLETNGWGIGFAAGRVMHPDIQPGPNQLGNTYFYIPVSFSLRDDDVIVHVNVGMLRDRQEDRNKVSMGVGSEFKLGGNFKGIAEVFGDHTQSPFYQFGVRYSLVPEVFQIDGTLGQQVNGDSQTQWLSIGVRWTP
ncbi:hypothetical protein [Methylophilus sp. 5]|uniref:hypothetical protein n=1 Tax=Methylophilus sp. 5 TaxID=1112274 RepID=UPI000490873F|nr:hypothetical protein [Methylophilus sp. 5]